MTYQLVALTQPPLLCPPPKAWNILALDGSNWQRVDLFNFQTDVEVS
jgi:hypothetical protein